MRAPHASFAVIVAAVLALPPGAAAQEIAGRPAVESGDTLRFGDTRVRLAGIAAPTAAAGCTNRGDPFDCARIAATALLDLIAGVDVMCREIGTARRTTRQGVLVARCTAGGYDLAEGMSYAGWARAWPRVDNPYRVFEAQARARGHGLWRAGATPPTAW